MDVGDLNGAGDVGESEYGEKADIGEGMSDAIIVTGSSNSHKCMGTVFSDQLDSMRVIYSKSKRAEIGRILPRLEGGVQLSKSPRFQPRTSPSRCHSHIDSSSCRPCSLYGYYMVDNPHKSLSTRIWLKISTNETWE